MIACGLRTKRWRWRKHIVQQNKRSHALAVSTRSNIVHQATHSSPNAHHFFISLTRWAVHSLQLVDCFINYVLCERVFAQLRWSTYTKNWEYCSHCLTSNLGLIQLYLFMALQDNGGCCAGVRRGGFPFFKTRLCTQRSLGMGCGMVQLAGEIVSLYRT